MLRKSRKDKHYQPEMPPVEGGEYLLAYLWEVGPTMAAGGYAGPVTNEEIRAWQELTGLELQPWEARFIKRLSGEYLAESRRAEKADCPEPTRPEPDVHAVAKSMQESMKALANL